MQTKRQIQELLASVGALPNRRLGQHFLVDLNLMRLLIDAAGIGAQDVVLEVGCGTGSLTEALAQEAGGVVAVELDRTLAALVTARLADADHVQIIYGDVLSSKGVISPAVDEALTRARAGLEGRLLLVANLPYDVASSVMANLAKGPLTVDAMFVTVQREVAQRMEAEPGSKEYGTLSILLGAIGEVQTLRVLKPSVFWPPPKVDSAIVRFIRNAEKCARIENMTLLDAVVGVFMGHRRKMLRACTKHIPGELGGRDLWMRIFAQCGVDPTWRPEAISPGKYVEMANLGHRLMATALADDFA